MSGTVTPSWSQTAGAGSRLSWASRSIRRLSLVPLLMVLVWALTVAGHESGFLGRFGAQHAGWKAPAMRWGIFLLHGGIAVGFWRAMVSRSRSIDRATAAIESQRKLAEQQAALLGASLAIFEAPTTPQSIRKIVEGAPSALGADSCVTSMISEDGRELQVVAVWGEDAERAMGKRFPLEGTNAGRALLGQQIVAIEDASKDPTVWPPFKENLKSARALLLPMFHGDGRPMGIIGLSWRRPGPFSPGQLQLAEVYASRSAVAVENAMLHDRARRDAEARAMLLRELNHRVKNTLAGIVGLLSAHPPRLDEAGQRWLGQTTHRIQTIARAHELFSSGSTRVQLGELVDRVLPPLTALGGDGVTTRTDLDGVDLTLEPQQAVSLAMVLHELIFNAMVHGAAAGGEVVVQARRGEDGQVVLRVIDSGGRKAAGRLTVGGGFGLKLVQELVGREIGGRFGMESSVGGGTVATVVIPRRPEKTGLVCDVG